MNKQTVNKEKGFTIIEVVLVLAIAGLIFLMVFIALPALQRGQRDQQRKNDLSRVQTAINSYQSNNRNALPPGSGTWSEFITKYLAVGGDSFIDPSGATTSQGSSTTTYQFSEANVPDSFTEGQNTVYISKSSVCGTDGAITSAGSSKIAARMKLEGGGVACVNN